MAHPQSSLLNPRKLPAMMMKKRKRRLRSTMETTIQTSLLPFPTEML
jgi:hypothetical protein